MNIIMCFYYLFQGESVLQCLSVDGLNFEIWAKNYLWIDNRNLTPISPKIIIYFKRCKYIPIAVWTTQLVCVLFKSNTF